MTFTEAVMVTAAEGSITLAISPPMSLACVRAYLLQIAVQPPSGLTVAKS